MHTGSDNRVPISCRRIKDSLESIGFKAKLVSEDFAKKNGLEKMATLFSYTRSIGGNPTTFVSTYRPRSENPSFGPPTGDPLFEEVYPKLVGTSDPTKIIEYLRILNRHFLKEVRQIAYFEEFPSLFYRKDRISDIRYSDSIYTINLTNVRLREGSDFKGIGQE